MEAGLPVLEVLLQIEIWESLIDAFGEILRFFHGVVSPVAGVFAWGWAIMLLTFAVRLAMLPLAVKQTTSMRGMQQLQPEIKKLQEKYKTDRSMMRTNPEKYRERRQKQQEEMMKLYREHNVNPAAGCLPLVLQMPIFVALFMLLRDTARVVELADARFYLIDSLSAIPPEAGLNGNMILNGAWLLMLLMGITTYYSQRQMMSSNPSATQMPQQRIMLYIMPVMLPLFSLYLPVGVLLYWVSTNLWTIIQQWIIFRRVKETEGPKKKA